MNNYQFTNKAVEDLSDIWNYTRDRWSEKQADKYYNEIIEKCAGIADSPRLGRSYAGITKSLEGVKVNKHIIFYRIVSVELIEIERILHERMDLKSRIIEK